MNKNLQRGKILAIDYGTKKIGLAVSDDARLLAFGRGFVAGGFKSLLWRLEELCVQEGVVEFVLGLPLNQQGEDGEGAERVRNFGVKLGLHFPDKKISYIDEAFSSYEAQKLQKEAGGVGLDDELAATIILQRFLDQNML